LQDLLQSLGLHSLAIEACLEHTPASRLVAYGKSLFIGLPTHSTWDTEEQTFLWIVCLPGLIVTIHDAEIPALKIIVLTMVLMWTTLLHAAGPCQPDILFDRVQPPPAEWKVDPFYKKSISAGGYPIVASERVSDYALKEAAYLVNMMLARRPDVREAMIHGGSRMCILAHNEFTTDLPEFAHFTPNDYWDARARGTGGSQTDPYCSCGEENLLGYLGDPYAAECILIHEFAHNMHLRGLVHLDPTFDDRLKKAHHAAMEKGLWKGKYASVNHHEYFAEGVQSWFDNNRENDHDHNHVDTRRELIEYDPGLAAICHEVFGETKLKYTKPATRLHGHLAGYDPSQSPRFVWPRRLDATRARILADAESRGASESNSAKP
ncbi:MAG: hypothetical protein ACC645_17495, partial [Pirellulales bacterium]